MEGINYGKWLVLIGLFVACFGVVVWGLSKLGIPFGSLPGDIQAKGDRYSFNFPIVTSIVVSIILTIGINFLLWLFRK